MAWRSKAPAPLMLRLPWPRRAELGVTSRPLRREAASEAITRTNTPVPFRRLGDQRTLISSPSVSFRDGWATKLTSRTVHAGRSKRPDLPSIAAKCEAERTSGSGKRPISAEWPGMGLPRFKQPGNSRRLRP